MSTEEEQAARLLEPLAIDPTGPSTIDITRAIADGRRIRRTRTGLGVTATVAATLAVVIGGYTVIGHTASQAPAGNPAGTGPSQAGQANGPANLATNAPPPVSSCKINQLPVPDGRKQALVTGMDPTGHLILGRSYPTGSNDDGARGLVVWHDGKPSTYASTGTEQALDDINTKGVAVGSAIHSTGQSTYIERPLVLNGATVTELPGTTSAVASAINEAGVIVGTSGTAPDASLTDPFAGPVTVTRSPTSAVRWDSPTAQPRVLPVPQGTFASSASAITEDGRVIGTITMPGKVPVGYMWNADGTGSQLKTPGLSTDPAKTEILIRGGAGDWIVGSTIYRQGSASGAAAPGAAGSQTSDRSSASSSPSGSANKAESTTGLIWNLRTGEFRMLPNMLPDAVSEAGWAAGGPTGRSDPDGTLQIGTTTVRLPALAKIEYQTTHAAAISADGTVIAGQSDATNEDQGIRPVTWSCS